MFSSAVARRVCAPALRPALGAARALPTTGTIVSTRMVSQSARQPSPRQPSAPASTTSSLLNRPWAANAGGWNSFLSEVGDSIPGSKRVPARSSERSAQAEGVTAKSEFDAIRESMPGLDVYNTRPRAPQVEDYDEEWRKRSASIVPALVAEGVPDAYSGRSFPVIDGNVNQAYRYLNSRLNQNNVRTELRRQVRHEKKGVKRRRLTSERWRRRFAEEVRKKVQLVQQIQMRRA